MPAGDLIAVNEVFQSIQGEAHFTGTPSVFLRLQGCAVGCPWCDTKHTWAVDAEQVIEFDAMLLKTVDAPTFAVATAEHIVWRLSSEFRARHIVITGGEPLAHDLLELTTLLVKQRWSVQIETSGTEPARVHPDTWITVSPKVGMPGAKALCRDTVMFANEIKIPVGKVADIERVMEACKGLIGESGVWLQPLSTNAKATALCIAEATARGWKLSVQAHKFIGVR